MFKSGLLAAGVVAIVTNAHADPEMAKRMLAASEAALKDAQSLSFVLKFEAKGMVSISVDGNVQMQRRAKTGGRSTGRTTERGEIIGLAQARPRPDSCWYSRPPMYSIVGDAGRGFPETKTAGS